MGKDAGQRSMSVERFGDQLRRLRQAAGMTQETLAERSGLSVRGISDLERGVKQRPHPETIRLLASALDLAPASLVSFRDSAAPRSALAPAVLPAPLTA
ncbi:MAG: helix-turn-helix transcriptional regulator, partial [Chloroflexia bacterium]|nr:helix-turn-helix transcriptional regulator [Chloroflexia bacterium]